MRAAPSRPLASPHRGATHGGVSTGKRVQLGLRIALVDADALQRACTANSLTALGADVRADCAAVDSTTRVCAISGGSQARSP